MPGGIHHFVHHPVADALGQVIPLWGLVEDVRDDAVTSGAKAFMFFYVGESTGLEHTDADPLAVRTCDVVQWTRICAV